MSEYFVEAVDCSRHAIFPGVEIQTASCRHMMMSLVEFQPNAIVEMHSHPHEQVGILLEGRATFFIGGEEKTLVKGDRWLIPGGVKHRVVASAEGAKALDVFCPIREDYL